MDEEQLDALVSQQTAFANREGAVIKDMWTPGFGWVLLNGEPTETSADFIKWLEKTLDADGR